MSAGGRQARHLIAAVPDSEEDADRIVSDVLLASTPAARGLEAPPGERAAEVSRPQQR